MTWMTTAQASAHVQITPCQLRRLAAAHEIPSHKALGRWRFDTDELDAWLRGERATTVPITTRPRRSAS